MRILSFSILIIILTTFNSCKKDNTSTIIEKELAQSAWEGVLTINGDDISFTADINISFHTPISGSYKLSDKSFEQYSSNSTLTYKQEGKILVIEGGYNNILLGEWWIIKYNNKELILSRNINESETSDTLNLNKNL